MSKVETGSLGRRETASGWRARRPARWTVAALATTAMALAVPGLSGAAERTAARPAAAGVHMVTSGSAYDWPQLGGRPSHGGWATNSDVSPANASKLAVRWAVNLHSPTVSSPIVTYQPSAGLIAYVGTQGGELLAYRVTTGQLLWDRDLGSPIIATPVGANHAVWTETADPPRLYKLNPVTGATECSLPTAGQLTASLTSGSIDVVGPLIFGAELAHGSSSGSTFAVNVKDCSIKWQFSGYTAKTGSSAPVASGYIVNHRQMVLAGTNDSNDTEYAIDAKTGKKVWSFAGPSGGGFDIDAGATVSRPMNNGVYDGFAYVPSTDGILYAVNLRTGKGMWSYRFDRSNASTAKKTGRSTPALWGTSVVLGHLGGVDDLNALTGKLKWSYADPGGTDVVSSVAIAGGRGHQVVVCADVSGAVHVLSLATGHDLYNYRTGGSIVSSPAVTGNDILISSTDGRLYDFAVSGSK